MSEFLRRCKFKEIMSTDMNKLAAKLWGETKLETTEWQK